MLLINRALAAGLTGVALAGTLITPAQATEPTRIATTFRVAAPATTSALESRRVDRVKIGKVGWYACYEWAQCATVKVPLDYDRPNGKTTTLALLRVKARNQKAKIGSLFVNPGGPGGSATVMALLSPLFLSDPVLDRFDILGMDPRGIGFSSNVKCFTSTRQQTLATAGFKPAFPSGAKEEAAFIKAAKALGKGCSTTGKTLAGAMSTAQVARDMDVVRRAVGDRKLTYLGFSYGSALGQYYANMFPDRFRALAVDGVINPVSWVGTRKTANIVQDDRLRSADGAYKALAEILKRCKTRGKTYCAFAAEGDPAANFATITRKLKAEPLDLGPSPLGGGNLKITYADFIAAVLGALYTPAAGDYIDLLASGVWTLLADPTAVTTAQRATAKASLRKKLSAGRRAPSRDFPYANDLDAYHGVMCTDGRHPRNADQWPAYAAKADKRAPYFGRAWAWASVACASNTWTVRDEDAYPGPFTTRTAAPVLIVGSYFDPATNYYQAVAAANLLPNSRLLTSNNWGHTAYGTSTCATGAIDRYLLRGVLPARGTICVGDDQPFTRPLTVEDPGAEKVAMAADLSTDPATTINRIATQGLPAQGTPKQLPPVAGRIPGSVVGAMR